MEQPPAIPASVWKKASQERQRRALQRAREAGMKPGDSVVSQTEQMDIAQEKLEAEILRRKKSLQE